MKVCMISGRKLKKEQQQKGLGSAPEKGQPDEALYRLEYCGTHQPWL